MSQQPSRIRPSRSLADIRPFEAPWAVYAMNCSPAYKYRVVLGSDIEDEVNHVAILEYKPGSKRYVQVMERTHPFPPTKVLWSPHRNFPELFMSTSDYLRLWRLTEDEITLGSQLENKRNPTRCGPLTSFDWNPFEEHIVGTSSIDFTCSIWDLTRSILLKQILAHSEEVNDIAFGPERHIFVSAGSDGSLRRFDLRNLEQCGILFETRPSKPIVRVAWNKLDPNYLVTVELDSTSIPVIDIRRPNEPVITLNGHSLPVNTVSWAPHSASHLCSAGDDKETLVWNLSTTGTSKLLAKSTGSAAVLTLNWSRLQHELVGSVFENKFRFLTCKNFLM